MSSTYSTGHEMHEVIKRDNYGSFDNQHPLYYQDNEEVKNKK